MYKLDPDTIYLNFLSQGYIKVSRFLNIEKIVSIISNLLVIETWQREYKKIKINGRIANLEYLKRNPQKHLKCFSNYYNNFSVSIFEELFRKIYIENWKNIVRA